DRDTEGYDLDSTPMPDPYTVTKIGHFPYCRAYLNAHRNDSRSMEDRLREKTMAYHLQRLSSKAEKVLFVGGLYHLPGLLDSLDQQQAEVIGRNQRKGVGLSHLHADSSREVMSEMPFLAVRYEKFRSDDIKEMPDRLKVNSELIEIARQEYRKNSKEELLPSRIRVLNRFVRNYSLVSGNLVPDFYQLIVAARGVADDDFAYEVWNKGSDYIWQTDNPDLPLLELKGEDLYQGQRRIRFHRRIRTTRRRLVPVPVRERRREKNPGEWKREFKGLYICSYPPEDVVIEGYGRHIQKRALEIKSEENSRVVPFETSMMDGIDMRRTLREWQDGKKIYVKENRPIRGKVGSVVVIFDEDLHKKGGKEEFPWKVTWLGEHDQESDMSFYATMGGEVMDGPGISRCQYGGFMLTYPPMRVYDIWRDPYFNVARNKPERLLMGAIDYCLERHVVYVAGNPPSGWCRSMAARHGKKIIYLPIGTFSPVTLRKLRQFHVLDGHHIRKYAQHYI
ncbi:MAG: hypothetical protein JW882_18585, partial [Deltaproteobacteria bacterium]|nr:hypothetical protein [Deltaproteobacteria bacterium]